MTYHRWILCIYSLFLFVQSWDGKQRPDVALLLTALEPWGLCVLSSTVTAENWGVSRRTCLFIIPLPEGVIPVLTQQLLKENDSSWSSYSFWLHHYYPISLIGTLRHTQIKQIARVTHSSLPLLLVWGTGWERHFVNYTASSTNSSLTPACKWEESRGCLAHSNEENEA